MATSTRRRAASVSDSTSHRSHRHADSRSSTADILRSALTTITDSLTAGRDDGHHHTSSHKSSSSTSSRGGHGGSSADDIYTLLQEAAYNLGKLVGDYETKFGVTPDDAYEHARRKKERKRERHRHRNEGAYPDEYHRDRHYRYEDDDGTSSRIEELPDDVSTTSSSRRKHRHRRDKVLDKNTNFDKGYGPAGAAAATPKSPGWPYDTDDQDITVTYASSSALSDDDDDSLYRFPDVDHGVPLHGDAPYDADYDAWRRPRRRDPRRDSGFVDIDSTGSAAPMPPAPYALYPGDEEPYNHDYEADNERLGIPPYIQPGADEIDDPEAAPRRHHKRHHRRTGTHRPGELLRRISSNPELRRRNHDDSRRGSNATLHDGNKSLAAADPRPSQLDASGRPIFTDPFAPSNPSSTPPSPPPEQRKSAFHPPRSKEGLKATSKNFAKH